MERVGMYNVQQQDLNIKPVQPEKVEKVFAEKMEKLAENGTEKQAGKDTKQQLGKVVIKQMKQLPKAFEEVATAVELAAKGMYMDRRNVAQKRFGGRGKFVDVTV